MDTIEWWAMLPFVLMLLCIAVLPLCIPLWWEQNRHKLYVSLMLSLPTSIYLIYMGMGQELTHQMLFEYVPFILLLLTLYIITGGIHVSGNLPARPYVTTTFLAIGYVLASVMGPQEPPISPPRWATPKPSVPPCRTPSSMSSE